MRCQRQCRVFNLIFASPCPFNYLPLTSWNIVTWKTNSSFVFLPSGGEHNAVFPTKTGPQFLDFPPCWQTAFSCLCIFPSFPEIAAVHTLTFALRPKAFTMDLWERPCKQLLLWQEAESDTLSLRLQQKVVGVCSEEQAALMCMGRAELMKEAASAAYTVY